MLVGEPGVGKSALAEGLAQMIINGQVPPDLENASLFQLDINKDLVAGASYKGEVEERLKQIVKAAENYSLESGGKKAILFIDEIHALLDKDGSVGSGAVNLLKPGLARGDLKVVGATTQAEYRKYVETDSAFKRRFTRITIEEPTEAQAIEILEGIAPKFEEKHQIKLDRKAIPEAVRLAKRYLGEKNLPASAVELIDLTLRSVSVANSVSNTQLDNFEKELVESGKADVAVQSEKLRYLHGKIRESISPVLMGRLEEDKMEETDEPEVLATYLAKAIKSLQQLTKTPRDTAEKEDLAAVIAEMSGIPLGKIKAQEVEKLKNMEASLRERVVGQDHALEAVANGIRRARVGLKDNPNEPIGSFLFLGPTATGKTELAKAIAGLVFDSDKALLRFDMSEFQESHTVSRLLGAPPGYVGYEEGGALINMIRQKPYSVVLFDEIEKAHPKVLDIFLQLLQDGRLTDNSTGKLGDFSNAVIVFTSNIGSSSIIQSDEDKDPKEMIDELRPLLIEGGFKPEFLRRMTSMIAFRPISKAIAEKILRIKLKNLFKQMKRQQGIELQITDSAVHLLIEKGYSKEFGAGPLVGAIQDHITSPLTDILLNNPQGSYSAITVDAKKTEFSWEKI
jgi:ATP-dependent Clp protease ATP-binding subunit ClpB